MYKTDTKPILAIETSGDVCSAAIIYNENKYSDINLKLKNIHSEKLLEIIHQLLEVNGLELSNFGSIAVSSGPGSFTGLRIGMSAAKGLAFGSNLPIIPVPTFEALALQISSCVPYGKTFVIAAKVNVDEVYFAKFLNAKEKCVCINSLQVLRKEDLDLKIDQDDLVFTNVILENFKADIRTVYEPSALYVGKWAYLFGKDLLNYNFDFLEPNYLKNFVVKTKGD